MNLHDQLSKYLNGKFFIYLSLGAIVAFFVINYLTIFDFKPDLNGDNVHYYALGKALASGKGYTNIMFLEETPHSHFPPGYPLFTALILVIFRSFTALKVANGVLFGLSIVLLYFLAKRVTGRPVVALCTCLLCCMQQAMLRYSTIVMSEMLFTFLSLGVLNLLATIDTGRLLDRARRRSRVFYLVLLVLALIYIYFVRTMGTSLILAVMLYLLLLCTREALVYFKSKRAGGDSDRLAVHGKALRGNLLVLCIILFSFAGAKTIWDLRNKSIGVTGSDYLKDFKKKPQGQTMATFSDWTERVQNNLTGYVGKWIPTAVISEEPVFGQPVTRADLVKGIAILVVILLGLARLKRMQLLLFLYIGITMAVLMIWPEQYAGHRYFIGIIPLFILLFLNGFMELLRLLTRKMKFKHAALFPATGMVLFAALFLYPRYAKALTPQQNFAKHKVWNEKIAETTFVEYIYAINWCAQNLPDTARVACRKPELFYFFSGGRKSTSFPHYASPEDLLTTFREQRLTHVIIDRWFRHGYVTVYPAVKKYPAYFQPLIHIGENTKKQAPTLIIRILPQELPLTPGSTLE